MKKTLTNMGGVMYICNCNGGSRYALCNPVFYNPIGEVLLKKYKHFIGKLVCFDCGGISEKVPSSYDSISGETVCGRLEELEIPEYDPNVLYPEVDYSNKKL